MCYFRKYLKYIIAMVVGVVAAYASWIFIVEPSYPYLLLDANSPIVDDRTGIGYLPIEMTGGNMETAIVKYMCSVPKVYAQYVHGADNNSIMNPNNWVGANLPWMGLIILVVLLVVFYAVLIAKKRRNK